MYRHVYTDLSLSIYIYICRYVYIYIYIYIHISLHHERSWIEGPPTYRYNAYMVIGGSCDS